MRKVNITFCSYPDYSGNSKALYLFMKKKYKDMYNYTWVFSDENLYKKYKDEVNCVKIGTTKYEKYISKTDIFFTTHVNLAYEKWKAKNSFYVELGHGIGMKPGGYLTHNPSDNELYWTHEASNAIDYSIVPSTFYSILNAAAMHINVRRCLPLGFPKLDFLFFKNSKEKLSMVINKDISIYKKVFFYLPTFRQGVYRNEKVYNANNVLDLKKYNEKEFVNYLEKNNYLFCIKKHPSDKSLKEYKKISDNIVEIDNSILQASGFDLNEIMSAADILVTDYSSVGIEFLFMDKPSIFLSTDYKTYGKNRGIIFDNFDFWSCNNGVDNINDFIKLSNKYLKGIGLNKEDFIKRKQLYFGNLKDGGCKNICEYFFDDGKLSKKLSHEINYEELNKALKYDIDLLHKEIINKDNQIHSQDKIIKELYESKIRLEQIEKSKAWRVLEKTRRIFKRK